MTSNTLAPHSQPRRTLRWCVAWVIVLFAALQLAEIGRYRTVGGDETYYMDAVYTMLQSGDWLVPRYPTGKLRFEKPIATYWAVASCCWVFGFTVWATRLHSVILALATLPYVWGLGRVTLRDRTGALLTLLVYVSIKSVHGNAHQGRTDAILSFFVAAAMYYFARALLGDASSRRDVVLGHAFAAGALLTKGLAAALYVYAPLALFALVARRRLIQGRARSLLSPAGLGTFALIAVPWFAYVLTTHADEFVRTFYRDQFTDNVGLDRPFFVSSFLSYVSLFVRETFPWWPVLLLGLTLERPALRRVIAAFPVAWVFHAIWLAVPFVVLSFANTTRGRYLLPALPAVALLVAALLAESGEDGRLRRALVWGVYVLSLGSLLLALTFLAMEVGPLWPHDLPWVGVPVVALLAASAWLSLRARRLDLGQTVAAVAALTLALLSCSNSVFEQPAPLCPLAELGHDVISRAPADTRVAVVTPHPREMGTVLHFSSGRRPEVFDAGSPARVEQSVRQLIGEPGPTLLVMEQEPYEALPQELKERLEVVDQRSALLEHGLREAPSPLLARLGGRVAEIDTVRVLAVIESPR